MPDIAQYTDYRRFLQDYYREHKKRSPSFSYQTLAQRAGLKSKGFLHNVLKGKRSLTPANVIGLAQAMRLSVTETEYLEAMVGLNNVTTARQRDHYYAKLIAIRGRGSSQWHPQVVRRDQYAFYAEFHNSVVRSLVEMDGYSGDAEALARRVWPRITPARARRSIALVERLGLARRAADGSYTVTSKSIATEPEVADIAVRAFHAQAGALALRALDELPRGQRNMTAVTLGMSMDNYAKVCSEIEAFRSRVMQIAENDAKADRVYQLNFQFFPVSTPKGGHDEPANANQHRGTSGTPIRPASMR